MGGYWLWLQTQQLVKNKGWVYGYSLVGRPNKLDPYTLIHPFFIQQYWQLLLKLLQQRRLPALQSVPVALSMWLILVVLVVLLLQQQEQLLQQKIKQKLKFQNSLTLRVVSVDFDFPQPCMKDPCSYWIVSIPEDGPDLVWKFTRVSTGRGVGGRVNPPPTGSNTPTKVDGFSGLGPGWSRGCRGIIFD